MNTIKFGSKGPDVSRWQNALCHRGYDIPATGDFDDATLRSTQDFQRSCYLDDDGVVGYATWNALLPLKPDFSPLSYPDRQKLFGTFSYVPAESSACPEAIRITDEWPSKNIVTVEVPLDNVGVSKIAINKQIATQTIALFDAWNSANLLGNILSWGGSWVPRYVRGSKTFLSNHAWGTAFDINAQWNSLGNFPALAGERGSVLDLVAIANDHGFYWGGHFSNRADAMHFEFAKFVEGP